MVNGQRVTRCGGFRAMRTECVSGGTIGKTLLEGSEFLDVFAFGFQS